MREKFIWCVGVGVTVLAAFGTRRVWHWRQAAFHPGWLALAAILCVVFSTALASRFEQRRSRSINLPRWIRVGGVVLSLALLAWLLYRLRPRRYYGDAGAVLSFVKKGAWFHKREPLSPAFFLATHTWIGTPLNWKAITSIQWTTSFAGMLGIFAIIRWSRLVVTGRALGTMAALAVISAGTFQLMAGYVENYTVPTMFGLWTMYFGTRAWLADGSVLPAVLCFVLGAATHLSLLTFGPAMLWLVLHRHYPGPGRLKQLLSRRTVSLLAVALLPTATVLVAMHTVGYLRANEIGFGGGDGQMFVPWRTKTGMSQYLFFSLAHLRAIFNLQILVAPLALVMLAMFAMPLLWKSRRQRVITPDERGLPGFLLLCGLGYFTLTVTWNPDLGALRDWDLFGPVGYYLSLPAVYLTVRTYRDTPGRAFALLLFVMWVNLSSTLPFVLYNLKL